MAEKKTQLYFKENGHFEFRQLQLEFSCLVEKSGTNLVRAYKHFYNSEIPFRGYKNISAGTVTLGFPRDIILDPFNKVPRGEMLSNKPTPTSENIKKWIAKIGETARHVYRSKRQNSTKEDIVNFSLIGVLFIEAIAWGIRYAMGG